MKYKLENNLWKTLETKYQFLLKILCIFSLLFFFFLGWGLKGASCLAEGAKKNTKSVWHPPFPPQKDCIWRPISIVSLTLKTNHIPNIFTSSGKADDGLGERGEKGKHLSFIKDSNFVLCLTLKVYRNHFHSNVRKERGVKVGKGGKIFFSEWDAEFFLRKGDKVCAFRRMTSEAADGWSRQPLCQSVLGNWGSERLCFASHG